VRKSGSHLRRTREIGASFSLHACHGKSSVAHFFESHACLASLWGYETLSGNVCDDGLCYVNVFASLFVAMESFSFRSVL
jgi:hypothetical protein